MATKKLFWRTEQRQVKNLLPFKTNPRKMSEKQIADLTKSLKKFSLAEIPAIDTNNRILAGHQRCAVLQLLGRGEEIVDVRVPSRPLTEQECKEYLLTSNAVHGSWNYDMLSEYFDVDTLVESGLSDEDISAAFADSLEVQDDDFDISEELKKIRKPKSKLGDIYELGTHRLACIDSRNPDMVAKLVGNERVDFIDVDPPFNISWSYEGKKGKYGGSYKDDKPIEEYREFLKSLVANSIAVSKKDAHFLFWCDQNYIGMLQDLYRELGINHKRVCLWVKNNQNPTPQVAFHKCYEAAVYGTIRRPFLSPSVLNVNEVMNKELGTGGDLIDGILDLLDIWLVKRLPGNRYSHPTEKPPSLHEKALRRCTKPGDLVLDLTAGSGSIMVACEQLKRRVFLAEMDPVFCDLIIRRFEKLTGKKARKISCSPTKQNNN